MGLAASQARFLAITARKADCEFRSMQIAQNKLSITREMELATQDYQQAINATKMVWDYDGNQSFLTDISYGFLMTPSYLNNFNPYLITDRGGRVIVDSKIAAAAEYAGIDPAEGGDRNPVNMYKFLEKLAGTGVISDKTKLDLENQIGLIKTGDHTAVFMTRFNDDGTKNWGADSGCLTNAQKDAFYRYVAANGITIDGQKYGGAGSGETAATMKAKIANLEVNGSNRYLQGKTVDYLLGLNPIADVKNSAHQVVTINGINYKFDGTTVTTGGKYNVMGKDKTCSYDMNAGYGSVPMSKNEYEDTGIRGLAAKLKKHGLNITYDASSTTSNNIHGKALGIGSHFEVNSVGSSTTTLADILTGDVCFVATYNDGDHNYKDYPNGLSDEVGTFLENAVVQIAKVLYKDKSLTIDKIKNVDSAFYTAYKYTAGLYGIENGNYGDAAKTKTFEYERDTKVAEEAISEAHKINQIVFAQNKGKDYNSSAAVDLSNLLSCFLTSYDCFVTGWNSKYTVDQDVADSFFVTQDPDYRLAILSEQTETNENVMSSDFYMQLFNNLCVNGYVLNDEVKDNKYLEQMLKNGVYYMCGVNEQDGYFYQARYNDDVRTLIKVVNDEDAKTRAESEYSYQKMRLTAKEDRLDLEMKNIDMEIASLTAEYDSVKNLISKSVEKTFKQFES